MFCNYSAIILVSEISKVERMGPLMALRNAHLVGCRSNYFDQDDQKRRARGVGRFSDNELHVLSLNITGICSDYLFSTSWHQKC